MRAAAWGFSDAGRLGWANASRAWPAGSVAGGRMPGGRRAVSWLPWPVLAVDPTRDLPLPPTESFRAWWRRVGRDEDRR